jgi:hypothetical protein
MFTDVLIRCAAVLTVLFLSALASACAKEPQERKRLSDQGKGKDPGQSFARTDAGHWQPLPEAAVLFDLSWADRPVPTVTRGPSSRTGIRTVFQTLD